MRPRTKWYGDVIRPTLSELAKVLGVEPKLTVKFRDLDELTALKEINAAVDTALEGS